MGLLLVVGLGLTDVVNWLGVTRLRLRGGLGEIGLRGLSVGLGLGLSLSMGVCLGLGLSLSVSLLLCVCVCMSLSLSLCLSLLLGVCLGMCLSLSLGISLLLCKSMLLSLCMSRKLVERSLLRMRLLLWGLSWELNWLWMSLMSWTKLTWRWWSVALR